MNNQVYLNHSTRGDMIELDEYLDQVTEIPLSYGSVD